MARKTRLDLVDRTRNAGSSTPRSSDRPQRARRKVPPVQSQVMQIVVRWTPWSVWDQRASQRERKRQLVVGRGNIPIAEETQIVVPERHPDRFDHIWEPGTYYTLQIGKEQSCRAFKTEKAALRRLPTFL